MSNDNEDLVTYYFVSISDNLGTRVQAWSSNKELVKLYLDFHHCKKFKVRSVTEVPSKMEELINDCIHDEIVLVTIDVKNPKPKPDKETIQMMIPITKSDWNIVSTELKTFMSTYIDYSLINDAYHFLKPKYQRAIDGIFLTDIVNMALGKRNSLFSQRVKLDTIGIILLTIGDKYGV